MLLDKNETECKFGNIWEKSFGSFWKWVVFSSYLHVCPQRLVEAAEEAHRQHEENPELQVRREKKRNLGVGRGGQRNDGASLGTLSRGWRGAAPRSEEGTVGP